MTTQQRIERIKAEAAELENATSDVRQFRKAKLFDQLLSALTAFAEETEKPIVPAMYEDDVAELISRVQDDIEVSYLCKNSIRRHARAIMAENKNKTLNREKPE